MKEKRKSKPDTPRDSKRIKLEESTPGGPEILDETHLYTNILNQINDLESENRQIAKLFLRLPSKKIYPDYYILVQDPISIHEIRDKANKSSYPSTAEFVQDFDLLLANAKIYNAKDSEVVRDAEQINRFVHDQVTEWVKQKRESDYAATFASLRDHFIAVLDDLIAFKVRGRLLSEIFMDEPDKRVYPEYYQVIKNATSFNTVRKRVNRGVLKTIDNFLEATKLIFDNAKAFNEESSLIHADAIALDKQLHSRVEKLRETITIPEGYQEWTGETPRPKASAPIIKVRLKELAPPPKLKLNLKRVHPGKETESEAEPETKPEKEAEPEAEPTPAFDSEQKTGEGIVDLGSNVDEVKALKTGEANVEDLAQLDEEGDEELDEEDGDSPEKLGEEVSNRRPEGKTAADAIIRTVNLTSVVPNTSRYQQAKNPMPPPTLMNSFQISFPAQDKYSVQSYSFALPPYQHTMNLSVLLHESLHNRYYALNVVHNYRKLIPVSSSASNPFADHSKPLKDRYEVRLTPGLNHIEVFAQASPIIPRGTARHTTQNQQMVNMEGSQQERLTLWVMLNRP